MPMILGLALTPPGSILSIESNFTEVSNVKIGFNIAMVCIVALLCIAAVTITGLAMGHNGTLVALSFTALGAVPAGIITWLVLRITKGSSGTKNGGV